MPLFLSNVTLSQMDTNVAIIVLFVLIVKLPLAAFYTGGAMAGKVIGYIMDLFNNPVGCFTSLADLAYFLQKSTKSARFLVEVVQ
jgi:hypothetical protein